jgi:capsular exopolysaccharide synthesis family protein
MSKMFDSLRRAERERERTADEEKTRSRPAPLHRRPRRAADGGPLARDFMRELGILRNSLEGIFKRTNRRSLLFTSATAGEGSTTIATSFARFLSMQGANEVLVCELNARTPNFAEVFSTNGDNGITDYFSADRELSSLIQRVGENDVDFLQVGRHDPTIIQLHLEDVFPRFLEEAYQRYDTVIIDAPPVAACPETPVMTGYVDGVVVVVHAGKTKREIVMRAMDAIENFNGEILGVVLNRKKYYIPGFLYKRL